MARSTTIQLAGRSANKKTKFVVGGVLIAAAIVYLIYTGIQSNAAYFLTVDELYAKGTTIEHQTVRVSGMVDATTINYQPSALLLAFDITSDTGERMAVVFNGPKPDQMREGAEAIVEGHYNGDTFTADSLLLKCPSRYEEGEIEQIEVQAIN